MSLSAAPDARPSLVGRIKAVVDQLSYAMAWVSGALFFLLSFYIVADVVGRSSGRFYSGVTDDISVYVLAVGGTWAMAQALRSGTHVSVDILIHLMPPPLRTILTIVSLAATTVFCAILSYYTWLQAFETFELGTRSITVLQAPLALPQSLMALGFTLLTVQALLTTIAGLAAPAAGCT